MTKKPAFVFVPAFILNLAWEVAHSRLYANYQGGAITLFVLARAAAADAVMILILIFVAQKFAKHSTLVVVLGGLTLAVFIEKWALGTGRWAYDAAMPIIPILNTGLTPTIQLAVTGYAAQKIVYRFTGD